MKTTSKTFLFIISGGIAYILALLITCVCLAQEPVTHRCNTVTKIILFTPGKELPDTIYAVGYRPDSLISYSNPQNLSK